MGEKNHVMWKKILNGGKIFKNIFKKNQVMKMIVNNQWLK